MEVQLPRYLTPALKRTLDEFAAFYRKHGYAPTYRELVEAGAASSSSVARSRVEQLENHGMIRIGRRAQARARSLTELGRVTAERNN